MPLKGQYILKEGEEEIHSSKEGRATHVYYAESDNNVDYSILPALLSLNAAEVKKNAILQPPKNRPRA
jgi:hypothetical protein